MTKFVLESGEYHTLERICDTFLPKVVSTWRASVVGEDAETHTVKGMYLADGTVFPSASGVNPMLTIAVPAHYAAQHIKARM